MEMTGNYMQEDEVNSELRSRQQVAVQPVNSDTEFLKRVLCLERYSKLKTVLQVTAWIKRFTVNGRSSTKVRGELTADLQENIPTGRQWERWVK